MSVDVCEFILGPRGAFVPHWGNACPSDVGSAVLFIMDATADDRAKAVSGILVDPELTALRDSLSSAMTTDPCTVLRELLEAGADMAKCRSELQTRSRIPITAKLVGRLIQLEAIEHGPHLTPRKIVQARAKEARVARLAPELRRTTGLRKQLSNTLGRHGHHASAHSREAAQIQNIFAGR